MGRFSREIISQNWSWGSRFDRENLRIFSWLAKSNNALAPVRQSMIVFSGASLRLVKRDVMPLGYLWSFSESQSVVIASLLKNAT